MSVQEWVQNHISQLVSALGGATSTGYNLGDEAGGCLLDIKKWLLNYDTKLNKWDVAAAISNTTLVDSDLVHIIAAYDRKAVPEKVALTALELVAHLTWPLESPDALYTESQNEHFMALREAQLRYKRAIVAHKSHAVFRAVIALTVPSLEKNPKDRSTRDKSIINLCINFVRNILFIEPEDRSATIIELESQKMLDFVILIASNQQSISPAQAVPILETLWGLLNSVEPGKLFRGKSESSLKDNNLTDLLQRERKLKNSRFRPTRHSRFGTMISLDLGDASLPVSGQQALGDDYFQAIDQSKTWRKPRTNNPRRREKVQWDFALPLLKEAQLALQVFAKKFLDAAYNPFFTKTKGFVNSITEEFDAEKIMHYIYLVGWFANAERFRSLPHKMDFKLIGVALNYSMFTLVCDTMANCLEPGPLQDFDTVHASMICLQSIFMAVDEMTRSSEQQWKEAADNILARFFYDELRLDLFARIPRSASKRTVGYQSETIELVHCVFKLLDFYASDKAVLFVRSRRKDNDDDEGEEDIGSKSKAKERRWDVDRYIKKFYHESTVDLYENALKNFVECNDKVLKHCLAFLHKLFIKKEMRALFYRLSFIIALVRATATTKGVGNPELFKGYNKFTDYYTRQLFKTLDKSPSLYIELLFHKQRQDIAYYDQGFVHPVNVPSKNLEFDYEFDDPSLSRERKIALCVAALAEDNRRPMIEWLRDTLSEFVKLQEKEAKLRVFCESSTKLKEISSIALMRLLLKQLGLVLDKGRYFIPAAMGSFELIEAVEYLTKYLECGLVGEDPHNHLRRTQNEPASGGNDDDDDALFVSGTLDVAGSESEDENAGFNDPRLQPLSAEELAAKALETHRKPAAKPRKETRRVSQRRNASIDSDSDESDEEGDDAVPAKKPRMPEPRKQYKSSAFVHASDDESDEERDRLFFAREIEQKLRTAREMGDAVEQEINYEVAEGAVNEAIDDLAGEDVSLFTLGNFAEGNENEVAIAPPTSSSLRVQEADGEEGAMEELEIESVVQNLDSNTDNMTDA